MRVIYKYDGASPPLSPLPRSGSRQGKESVIVISSEKKPESKPDESLSFSGDGFDVKISREALERNSEVRRHEKAHMAALGSAAKSGIMYNTMKGPGGETIAVGGKIAVDLSEVPGDPAATLSKARTVISAAFAPSSPSGPDVKTAMQAYGLAKRAQEQMDLERIQGKIDILA